MALSQTVERPADADAFDWARRAVAFDEAELISASPWAKTYRLVGESGAGGAAAYLKLLPPHQVAVLTSTLALTGAFEHQLPRVLAHDASAGWLLSADHGGRELDYDAEATDLVAVVQTYARMQVAGVGLPALRAGLPRPDLKRLPHRLLAFLNRQSASGLDDTGEPVGADYFLGADDAARYARLLGRRIGLIETHLAAAAELPDTVNHGDLRPPNTAVRADGGSVIIDWDDAVAGPAGMSLHGLFGGCVIPTILLSGSAAAQAAAESPHGKLVHAYVQALADGGYASAEVLHRALPAAICAGVIQFILNFARFPGESARSVAGGTMGRRLSGLLDLCDLLGARDRASALALAQEYEDEGELRRARNVLQDLAARTPDDLSVLPRLAAVLRARDEHDEAAELLREAIERQPEAAVLHASLGTTLMQLLDIDGAQAALRQALALDPTLDSAGVDLQHTEELAQMRAQAAEPGRMPTLHYEAQTTGHPRVRPDQIALGVELFNTYGTLQIDNAFPVALIEKLQAAFFDWYAPYFREGDHPDALRLGDKRYMLTVDMKRPFDDPGVIGAPTVLPIIRKLLDDDCVLGAFTSAVSLPGSLDQRLHKDHPALYANTEWHFALPAFAAQIIIPLVPLDHNSGTTRFYKGSHKVPTAGCEALGHQDPMVPLGSCLLNDYRCAHRGLGNRSDKVRPILTLTYNRPWFHDYKNYGKQPPLRISDASYEKLPADVRSLVAWWKEERSVGVLDQALLR